MSLKLIKTAQIVTSTSEHELKVLGVLSEATGKPLYALAETQMSPYQWTPEDYQRMLELIQAYGEEEGLNVNKRGVFNEIARAALENDSMAPVNQGDDDAAFAAYEAMQSAIVNKLWNDYKAAKQQAKINKLASAAEEEEMLKANLRRLSQGREEEELGYDQHRGEQVTTSQQDDDAYWADQEDQPLPRYEPLPHPLDREEEEQSDAKRHDRFHARMDARDTTATEQGDAYAVYRSRGGKASRAGFEEDLKNLAPWERHNYIHNDSDEEEEYGQGVQSPNYQDNKTGSSIEGAERFGHLAGYLNKHAGANDTFTYGTGSENEEQSPTELNPTLDRNLFASNDAKEIANRARLHAAQENEERAKAAEFAAKNNPSWGKRVNGSPEQSAHRAADVSGGGYKTRGEYLSAIKRANKRNEENEEVNPMATKPDTETADKAPKTPEEIAHHILTAPRELMRDATKSIKSDGAKAWDEHELPKNPHPIKSAAHKHWLDGMRKAAIASLGLEPKPTEAAKKKR